METGIYIFMCGYHLLIFAAGMGFHWAWKSKVWRVRGFSLKYAGDEDKRRQAGQMNPYHQDI